MADTKIGSISKAISYTDTTSLEIGHIPPNSIITAIRVLIATDFQAGVIDVGNATVANQFADNIAATAVGAPTVTLQNVGAVLSATNSTKITAIYVPGSTSPNQGAGFVVVEYVQL